MRNFVLHDEDGTEHGIFTGKQPRQAALKAANRCEGTKKMNSFGDLVDVRAAARFLRRNFRRSKVGGGVRELVLYQSPCLR